MTAEIIRNAIETLPAPPPDPVTGRPPSDIPELEMRCGDWYDGKDFVDGPTWAIATFHYDSGFKLTASCICKDGKWQPWELPDENPDVARMRSALATDAYMEKRYVPGSHRNELLADDARALAPKLLAEIERLRHEVTRVTGLLPAGNGLVA